MSEEPETTVKAKLSLATIIAIFGAYGAIVAGYALQSGRVNANERRIQAAEVRLDLSADIRSRDLERQNADREAISRIDERTKYIVGQVQEIKAQVDKR